MRGWACVLLVGCGAASTQPSEERAGLPANAEPSNGLDSPAVPVAPKGDETSQPHPPGATQSDCEQSMDCPCANEADCPPGNHSTLECSPLRCGEPSICRYGTPSAAPDQYFLACTCEGVVGSFSLYQNPRPAYAQRYPQLSPSAACQCRLDELCERSVCMGMACDPELVPASGGFGVVVRGADLPYADGTQIAVLGSGAEPVSAALSAGAFELELPADTYAPSLRFLIDENADGLCTTGEQTLAWSRELHPDDGYWSYTVHADAPGTPCPR